MNDKNFGRELVNVDFNELKTIFKSIKDPQEKINRINELYRIIKSGECTTFITKIINKVEEDCLLDLHLCESMPDFIYPNGKIKYSKDFDEEELLNYLIIKCRTDICDILRDKRGLEKDSLENLCDTVSLLVQKECSRRSIKSKRVLLSPYLNSKKTGGFFHYANVVTIGNNNYIVDLSYRQFFTLVFSALERIGMPGYSLVLPGIFMMMNESRYKTAYELLKKGYIKATDENVKNYMDGFIISYRNGLFYDDMGFVNYSTYYTADDYRSFLYEGDKSFYDMPLEYIGFTENNYQIQNSDLVFDKDGNNYLRRKHFYKL